MRNLLCLLVLILFANCDSPRGGDEPRDRERSADKTPFDSSKPCSGLKGIELEECL